MRASIRWLPTLLLLAAAPPLLCAQDGGSARPNLVLIISDDHRWDALGSAGNTRIHTPTLDRLATDGLYFRQATIFVSQCMPSRAVLLTGLPPHANGIYSNFAQHRDLWWRDELGMPTVPSLLRDAGYHTLLVGKWHLAADPWKTGFSEVRTWLDSGVAAYRDARLSHGNSRARRPRQGFTNQIFTDDAVAFLASPAAKERPFLLWLALTAPHGPMQPNPDSIVSLYDGHTAEDLLPPAFPREARPEDFLHYSESVTVVDDATRRVLEALETHGLGANTVVVFLGDNGYMMGSRGMSGKVVPYEESVRVPLIVRMPGMQARGTSDAAVSSLDLPPTLLRLAGVAPPASWPGRDMSELLATGRAAGFDHAFAEWADTESWFGPLAHRLVRTPDLKLIRWERAGMREELYDLRRDPHETTNVALDPAYSERRQRLAALLDGWLQRTADPARDWPSTGVPHDPPAPYPGLAEARALQVVVDPQVLAEYVGAYELVHRAVVRIELRGGRLFVVGDGNGAGAELVPLSATEFLQAPGRPETLPITITFDRDAEGRVSGLIVRQRGYPRPARRMRTPM